MASSPIDQRKICQYYNSERKPQLATASSKHVAVHGSDSVSSDDDQPLIKGYQAPQQQTRTPKDDLKHEPHRVAQSDNDDAPQQRTGQSKPGSKLSSKRSRRRSQRPSLASATATTSNLSRHKGSSERSVSFYQTIFLQIFKLNFGSEPKPHRNDANVTNRILTWNPTGKA